MSEEKKPEIHNVFENQPTIDHLMKEPIISLTQAKNEIEDLLHTEYVRHESVLEVAMATHESAIRVENAGHELRVEELEKLVEMLDARIEKRKE